MTGSTRRQTFVNPAEQSLEPLPYHVELREYLKSRERDLWNWFASASSMTAYHENLRLELLKSTYRLDASGHAGLYQSADEAKTKLGLDIPVTLYQGQNSPHPNAALYFMRHEAHIVLSGPILTLLNSAELQSVIGHELAHYDLWARHDGDFHVADRLLQAVVNDPRAAASHIHTQRRFQLYTEIFADRGSFFVTGDIQPVIAGLVKIQTGIAQISATEYLKQADEIFAKGDVATEGLSHPETFIRARALALWQAEQHKAAPQIAAMIEGTAAFDELDLLGQARLTQATRRLLEYLLQPAWFQTPAVLGHARLFFDDFRPVATRDQTAIATLASDDPKLREYLCYLLLDFVTADPELDELPLAAALELSRQLGMDPQFEKLAAKELSMKSREVRRIREHAAEMLAKAEVKSE